MFQEMLEDSVTELCSIEENDSRIVKFNADLEEAEEEIETPMPCAFEHFLHFTSISKEQALEDFKSLFGKHVAQNFAKDTKVLDLLATKGYKVFIPQSWEGIKGVDPIELTFKGEIPKMKPAARPVNPRLFDNAKKEFDRLFTYMYVPSNSDVASPLVIAPKATKPFIRFCGDYTKINKFIMTGHFSIPNVIHEIQKLIRFKVFLDIDMKTSFHQLTLSETTSEVMSIQTPWGQVRPLFLQEGVGPASGILQKTVQSIFIDFDSWMIVIFDNFLILATDYQDAYAKLELFIDRCIERNIYCNFEKTWLGFAEVNFFGFKCSNNKYEVTEERDAIPFPNNVKEMQRFLGMILFCSKHIKKRS